MHTFQPYPIDMLEWNPIQKVADEGIAIVAEADGVVNAMSSHNGGVGHMWGKNVVYAFLRNTRYTKELLDKSEYFSACFFDMNDKNNVQLMKVLDQLSGRNEDKADSAVAGEADPDAKTGQNLLTVHVCGAVKNEGVYSLPAGSRIFDAVKAAGGFSDNADRSYLNLAMEVEDAWQIRIPSKEETEALRRQREVPEQDGSTGSAEDGKDIYGKLTGPDTPFIVKGPAPADGAETGGKAGDIIGDAASGQNSGPEGVKINLNTASKEELMIYLDILDRCNRLEPIENALGKDNSSKD